MSVSNSAFMKTVDMVCSTAGRPAVSLVERDRKQFSSDKDVYVNKIKNEAEQYKMSVKAIKELSEIKKLLPDGKYAIIDLAGRDAKGCISRVSGYRETMMLAAEKLADSEANLKDLESSVKCAESQNAQVKKLIKSGFIESINYKPEEGLSWVYPPMLAEYDKPFFLGRPRICLNESSGGFGINLPSYGKEYSLGIGSYHFKHRERGDSYCLGGYSDILHILAAKRQLSSMIRIFRDYLLSYNPKSTFNTPPLSLMSIDNPKVVDDSWIRWKESNPEYKLKPASEIVHAHAFEEGEDGEES